MRTLVQNNMRAWRIRRDVRKAGFKMYSRRQWKAVYKDVYSYRRNYRPVRIDPADTVVQHITVTRPSHNPRDFKFDVRQVERIGFERFGAGISYNFLVDMTTGEIAEGMPLDAKGTHTVNDKGVENYSYDQNHAARAIAVVGMPDTELSADAAAAITVLLRAMVRHHAITEGFDYVPHSLFAAKDCPCDSVRKSMPAIRGCV
jgi:hypothetical protein